jgi:hypothetical protein
MSQAEDEQFDEKRRPFLADEVVGRIVELVGPSGVVAVATFQAEFDRVVTLTPRRCGAMGFTIRIIGGGNVVLEGPLLGWWTFGDSWDDDGAERAWRVIEQLVVRGGSVRHTWRSSELLDTDGRRISGPYREGLGRLRPQRVHFLPYWESDLY